MVSMSPLMKTLKLCEAALTSSGALEMFNLAINSSSTFALFWFSFDVDMVGVVVSATEGMLGWKRKKEGKIEKFVKWLWVCR